MLFEHLYCSCKYYYYIVVNIMIFMDLSFYCFVLLVFDSLCCNLLDKMNLNLLSLLDF